MPRVSRLTAAIAAVILLPIILLAVLALSGREDDGAPRSVKNGAAPEMTMAGPRVGIGWRRVSDARVSVWGFTDQPDGLDDIRSALESRRLPPKSSVRIAALVDRFATGLPKPEPGGPVVRPSLVLTTTPWNDDTLLLWIGIAGTPAPDATPSEPAQIQEPLQVSVEFNAATVAAYRPLGDPATLPLGGANPREAAVLYELAPIADASAKTGARYATLHLRYKQPDSADARSTGVDQTVTDKDLVESLDDAPDTVRFAAAIAGFGGLLRGDPAVRDLSCDDAITLAESAVAPDPDGARARIILLMQRAEPLLDLPTGDPVMPEEPAP